MKVVKLDRRHTFYKDGFKFAFTGSWEYDKVGPIESYLTRVYGHHNYDRDREWYSSFSKHTIVVNTPYGGIRKARAYYIALRNEADVTACLLAAGV